MNNIEHTILLDNKEFQILIDYRREMQILPNLPQKIGMRFLKNECYEVQSRVSHQILQKFLDFWAHGTEPEVNSDEIFEYYLLSQEFGLMGEYLSKKIDNSSFNSSILKYLSEKRNCPIDKSDYEQYIAMNLNSFLEDKEDDMMRIPLISLINIFFHKKRVLNDQQKAFNFIEKLLNSSNENHMDYSILLSSLNADQLNKENIIDCIERADEHFGFHPKVFSSFFTSYNEKIDQLTQENQKLKMLLNESGNNNLRMQTKQNQLNSQVKEYEKRIQELESNNLQTQTKLDQLNSQFKEYEKKIQELENNKIQMQLEHDGINSQVKGYVKKIQEFESNNLQMQKKNEQLKKSLKNLKNTINEMKIAKDDIQKEVKNICHNTRKYMNSIIQSNVSNVHKDFINSKEFTELRDFAQKQNGRILSQIRLIRIICNCERQNKKKH